MLNLISTEAAAVTTGAVTAGAVTTGAATCARFGVGAVLPSSVRAARSPSAGGHAFGPRRVFWASEVFGQGRKATGLGMVLGQRSNPRKPYPHTTRIAPSGDARGPHSVREPV